jgi:hypothetical protein
MIMLMFAQIHGRATLQRRRERERREGGKNEVRGERKRKKKNRVKERDSESEQDSQGERDWEQTLWRETQAAEGTKIYGFAVLQTKIYTHTGTPLCGVCTA